MICPELQRDLKAKTEAESISDTHLHLQALSLQYRNSYMTHMFLADN